MVFLDLEDFYMVIREEELDDLTVDTPAIVEQAELAAMRQMESYLRQRYDVSQIWAQTGADRDAVLVMYLVDMALYHANASLAFTDVPQQRKDRYDTAISWLKAVARGEISPDLPAVEETADKVRYGSNPKLGHGY